MIPRHHSHHATIKHILELLFTAEHRRLKKFIAEMIKANEDAWSDRFDGFVYMGRFYRYDGLRGKLKFKTLHQNLAAKMDEHLADEQQIKMDKQDIKQILYRLLEPCRDQQEVRDALPNCLTDTLGSAARLQRTRSEAWTLEGDERAMRQYEKVLPRIQFYSAARLLY